MTYYKCLQAGAVSPFQSFKYTPNEWMPKVEKLEKCGSGYHVCDETQLVRWLSAEIWECEIRGEVIHATDKTVAQEIRITRKLDTWNERTARLFSCDCAERVMPIYSKRYPTDNRCQNAIDVARKFANGNANADELAAARDAAWAAAGAAAGDAARAAARDAAWAAARAAAGAAARAAAGAAAGDAEYKWQSERLMQYLRGEL